MSGVKTVENLTIAFSGTNLTATGTLTKGQVAANCIPFVTFRSTRDGNESFDDRFANCTIDGSTVTLRRNTGTSFTLEYKVSVVEFEPSLVKVQTGEVTMTGTSQTDAPGTNFADIADVFMVFTHITTDGTDDLDALTVRGQVTNTSTITFTRGDSANQHTMRWYAAEALSSEFSVIRSSFTISGASVSATDTISSVTSAKSFTIFSTSETGETTDDWRDGVGRGDLQSDTLVRFRRSNGGIPTGATITIEYQVVTFADNETVQRGEFSMGSGSTSDTDTITALTNAESTAWSPMIFGRGEGASVDGDDMGQMHAAMDFTSDTVIRGQLVTDVTAGLWSWEAIEWELPVIGVNSVDTDNDIDDAQTGVVVAGFGFNAAQGTGLVEIGDSSDYATANKVTQTVTAWGDTSITITADLGSQAPGTKYLFVTDDDSNRSIGFAIAMHRAKAFAMSLSGNIAVSGENTTAQLTAPTSGTFGGGRIQDDENPTDTVDIGDDQFREDEWCIEALPAAVGGETYQFRVLFEGVVADTITVTPQLTISSGITASGVPSITKPTSAGTAEIEKIASGSPSIPTPTASGTAEVIKKATGAVIIAAIIASGVAEVRHTASGAVSIPLLTAAGSALTFIDASGAPLIPMPVAAGVAEVKNTASGAVSIPLVTAAGTATVTAVGAHTANGAPSVPLPTASGVAEVINTASGAPSIPAVQAAGVAEIKNTASGAVVIPSITAVGVAETKKAASGAVSIPLLTVSGVAEVKNTATGAPVLPSIAASGVAVVTRAASGVPSIVAITAAGVARIVITADAAVRTHHTLSFSSVSQSMTFSAVQQRTTFTSVSVGIKVVGTVDPLGFLLKEDGGILLQENDLPIALE